MRKKIGKKDRADTSLLSHINNNMLGDVNMTTLQTIGENGTALNSINENVAILNNAYDNFFSTFKKKVRVSNAKPLTQPTSLSNYVKYMNERIEGFEKAYARNPKTWRNANLLKANVGQTIWTVGLYLSKQIVEINGSPFIAEFGSFEDAINGLKCFVSLVEDGNEEFVSAVEDAIVRYEDSLANDPRINKGHS